ncbi:antitoxin VbhA family protein [Microbacterium sp.]|uniref:antitoxin VbhA family protein n=1 Tax=Microbacterium sp. TaxID=51671 RepID=UPI003A839EDE
MATKTRVSEAHVERVVAEVLAGQQTAGAQMSPEAVELGRRQVRGEITVDEAVEVIAARTRARLASRTA